MQFIDLTFKLLFKIIDIDFMDILIKNYNDVSFVLFMDNHIKRAINF